MQDLTEGLKHFWDSLSVPVQAAVFSGILAFMRVCYDVKDGRKLYRKTLECGTCIGVTFATSMGLPALGISESAGWLISVALGWLGADYVRERGRIWAEQKVKENER